MGQVDSVQIALNYRLKENWLELLQRRYKIPVTEVWHGNSLQDGSRFINAHAKPGYCLVCDDDIIYPPDFVETMVNWHTAVGGFITVMGKVLKPRPLQSYYKGWAQNFRTFDKIDQLQRVDIPGCCGIMWHTKEVLLSHYDMEIPNSDVVVGVHAMQRNIPCHVIPHAADWLTNLMPELPKDTLSIFGKYRKNDKIQTDYINRWM
jgi:hypothetical protein